MASKWFEMPFLGKDAAHCGQIRQKAILSPVLLTEWPGVYRLSLIPVRRFLE